MPNSAGPFETQSRWLLVTGQGGITALGGALLFAHLPVSSMSPVAFAIPLPFVAATMTLVFSPASARTSIRLHACMMLLNILGILGLLIVTARAEPALLLAYLLTLTVGAGARNLAVAAIAVLAVPPVVLGLGSVALSSNDLLPQGCLMVLMGLQMSMTVRQIELDWKTQHETLRGFEDKITEQAPLVHLGRFAQGLAHEFHNVLGGVQGLLDYAARSEDPKEIREALEVSARTLQRAGHIVENLKTFTREVPLERHPCDLAQVVSDSLTLIAHECRRARINVETDFRSTPTVMADPARLQQVFLNLELNAARAMRPGGRLTVRIDTENGDARVAFSDTGCGIQRDDFELIFKPQFTTHRESDGLGLGLFVSDRIIRAHGGSINVQSVPEQGSTFTVHLPVAAAGS